MWSKEEWKLKLMLRCYICWGDWVDGGVIYWVFYERKCFLGDIICFVLVMWYLKGEID